ncbi:MAG: cohesin domain-containing protein [Candidatus Paceibacterales bacterium]
MKRLFLILIILILSFAIAPSVYGQDASFYISPSAGDYKVGEKFFVDVLINVGGTSINAAQATVYFSPEKLKVLEVSKEDSIFSLWAQEPVWSNTKGEISFVGGLPSPGFIGKAGKVMTVLFQAKSSGEAEISFGKEKILANEPKGMDIFSFSQEVVYPISGPEFEITIDNEGDPTNPRPLLYLSLGAEGEISEISYYEVRIGEEVFKVKVGENLPWQMPNLTPGSYSILVKAIDKAGNVVENRAEVMIESIPVPQITLCPETFISGQELLYIGGNVMPESSVLIFFEKNGKLIKKWEVLSDEEGNWFLRKDGLFKPGIYTILAKTKDSRGAISNPSEPCFVKVFLFGGMAVGPLIMSYENLALLAILLLIVLFGGLFYFSWRIRRMGKLIERETRDLKEKFYKEYNELYADIEKELELLRKVRAEKGFTEKEKEIEKELLKNLADVERVLREELKDIKEIK